MSEPLAHQDDRSTASIDDRSSEQARARRRSTVLGMLAERPANRYAWCVEPARDHVFVAVAIRDIGAAELTIEAERYDDARMLEIIAASAGEPRAPRSRRSKGDVKPTHEYIAMLRDHLQKWGRAAVLERHGLTDEQLAELGL